MGGRRLKNRAALYYRPFDKHDDRPELRDLLRLACEHHGYRIVMDVQEDPRTAHRPGRQQILDAAELRHIDAVFVTALHQFTSNETDLLTQLRQLHHHGVRFVSPAQRVDIHPAHRQHAELQLTLIQALATLAKKLLNERIRRGIERARGRGQPIGRPPVPRPPTAKVQALRQAGYTWEQTAQKLRCSVWAVRLSARAVPSKPVPRPRKRRR